MQRSTIFSLLFAVACTTAGPAAVDRCEPEALVSVGEALPDCSFAGVGDQPPVNLIELQGKPLVLNFWASWCSACVKEMPDFQRVHGDLGSRVWVLGMNTLGVQGETEAAATTFAQATGVRYRLAFDAEGLLYSHFGSAARPVLPMTVLVDEDGVVRHIRTGQVSEAQLRALIAKHLGVA
jgi:peroxiredoxin